MSRNAGNYENGDFGEISSNSPNRKISQSYANDLAILAKFPQIRQISQNNANGFIRCYPAIEKNK